MPTLSLLLSLYDVGDGTMDFGPDIRMARIAE